MLFEEIFRGLQNRRVRYLVVGGIAVNLHGFTRATADLDLLLSPEPEDVRGFVDLIKELGWKPRIPEPIEAFAEPERRAAWMREKRMKVYSVYNPKLEAEHLDVLIDFPGTFPDLHSRRKEMRAGELQIPVISIPDLIVLKKAAARERDRLDIRALEQIQEIEREEERKRRS